MSENINRMIEVRGESATKVYGELVDREEREVTNSESLMGSKFVVWGFVDTFTKDGDPMCIVDLTFSDVDEGQDQHYTWFTQSKSVIGRLRDNKENHPYYATLSEMRSNKSGRFYHVLVPA